MSISLDFSRWSQGSPFDSTTYHTIQTQKKAGQLGFIQALYAEADLKADMSLAATIKNECGYLVLIGIGGSDLGARAVYRALGTHCSSEDPQLLFIGDTTDPQAIQELLAVIDLQKTCLLVVSKSGNTIEQMSTFLYLREQLKKAVGESKLAEHIIVLTDAEQGSLRQLVRQEGYPSLVISADVGGRYSVLTSAGLFPLAVAGLDVTQLLAGAQAMDAHDSQASEEENLPYRYAQLQYQAYQAGQKIAVLMPYAYSLQELGRWFRQLWAESLGKKDHLNGHKEESGPTPIAALGPTDQHSQLQLYLEGPLDKCFTFIQVEKSELDLQIPDTRTGIEGIDYLSGRSFQAILQAELQSTAQALASAGRSSCILSLSELAPYTLGQLLCFFELATVYMGEFLQVNPFDQPGVEISKQYMYGILERPGYAQFNIPLTSSNKSLISTP